MIFLISEAEVRVGEPFDHSVHLPPDGVCVQRGSGVPSQAGSGTGEAGSGVDGCLAALGVRGVGVEDGTRCFFCCWA